VGTRVSRDDWDEIIIFVGGADGALHAVGAYNGDPMWKTDVGNNISKASPVVSLRVHLRSGRQREPGTDRLIA
jgi:outer membrane protein assembly factor BamB